MSMNLKINKLGKVEIFINYWSFYNRPRGDLNSVPWGYKAKLLPTKLAPQLSMN